MQGTAVVEAVRKAEHKVPVVACCTLAAYRTDPAARSQDEWSRLEGKLMAESLVLHMDAEPAPGGRIWFHHNLDRNPVVQSEYKELAAAHNLDPAVVHNYNLLEKAGPWQSQEHENAWGVVQMMQPYGHPAHHNSHNQSVQEAPAACSSAVFAPNQNCFLVAVVVVDNSRNPVSRVDSEMDRLLGVDSYTQIAVKGDLWVPN